MKHSILVLFASTSLCLAAPAAKSSAPPPAATPAPAAPAGPPKPQKPQNPLVNVIETLYQKQLFEAADVVLGLAFKQPNLDPQDRARLLVLEGILRMEAFQEPQATKVFREALELDRLAVLPDFAPPKTRRLYDDIRAVLPQPVAKLEPSNPPPPPETVDETVSTSTPAYLPWIPIAAGGALMLTGGGLVIGSRVVDNSLRSGSPDITTPEELDAAVSRGKAFQTSGYVLVGVGTAALVGGILWKLSPEYMPLISVVPTQNGMATVFSGKLPWERDGFWRWRR